MKISYKKLWVMLIEREIPKAVFRKETELSPGTMSKHLLILLGLLYIKSRITFLKMSV